MLSLLRAIAAGVPKFARIHADPEKAFVPMRSRASGTDEDSFAAPRNAYIPISVILSGISALTRFVQL